MNPDDFSALERIESFLALDPNQVLPDRDETHPWQKIYEDINMQSLAKLFRKEDTV